MRQGARPGMVAGLFETGASGEADTRSAIGDRKTLGRDENAR